MQVRLLNGDFQLTQRSQSSDIFNSSIPQDAADHVAYVCKLKLRKEDSAQEECAFNSDAISSGFQRKILLFRTPVCTMSQVVFGQGLQLVAEEGLVG